MTRDSFANLEHRDNDHGPYNFGFFWAGNAVPENKDWVFNGKVHGGDGRVIGGEFWWPGFGIVAGAAREEGTYAEIIWRGQYIHHGTLVCELAQGESWKTVNRWACSLQATTAYYQRKNNVTIVNATSPILTSQIPPWEGILSVFCRTSRTPPPFTISSTSLHRFIYFVTHAPSLL